MEEIVFKCITCNAEMTAFRGRQFPICDECLNIIKRLIADKKMEDIAAKIVAKMESK